MILWACLNALWSFGESFSQEAAIAEISEAAATITTMQCDFVQTKSLKMLGDKLVSKGLMACTFPDKLRWEYLTPYTYTFVLNNNQVHVKKGRRSDLIDVNQNKMFKGITRIMMNSVLGKCLTDKDDFHATVVSQGDTYLATLLPQKKEMKQMFSKIVLRYDRKMAMVITVELHERNGDNTVIELTNIRKNEKVNAARYQVD